MTDAIKLLIGVASNRKPHYAFMECLDMAKARGRARGINGIPITYGVTLIESSASLLPQGRQNIIDYAFNNDFTHLALFDDDMTFPDTVLDRLHAHNLPAMGVNATRRMNARAIEYTATDLNNDIIASYGKTGIQEVSRCGLSVFLINLAAIRNVPQPHFEIRWDDNWKRYRGEDSFFCDKLREHGVPVHIDHGLSHEIGHIGDHVYNYESCTYGAK